MEPDVIRMYSSSPPPMEDGAEEEEDEFGDFGGFSTGVPNSISFTEFDTPTSFNQSQGLAATSPPELLSNGGVVGRSSLASANGTSDLSKVNGLVPGGVCQTDSPSERTVGNETKKVLSNATDLSGSGLASVEIVECNGTGAEVLTNGFATFEVQGSPPLQKFVHSHKKGNSTEDMGALPPSSPEDNFADFAAFPGAEGHHVQAADISGNLNNPRLEEDVCQEHSNIEQGMTLEDNVRDTNGTGSNMAGSDSISFSAEAPDDPSNGDRGSHTDADSKQRDIAFAHEQATSEAVCTKEPVTLNGVDGDDFQEAACGSENDLSPETAEDSEGGQLDGKGSGNETETETETSFGRPLSTDALEEYGDMSTTGSVPSPPLPEDNATPADHSQLGEEDDEDFGDFGDAASFSSQGFADFDQLEPQEEKDRISNTHEPEEEMADEEVDDDFGDFDTPKFHSEEAEDGSTFADFPCSDSFGNFTTAPDGVEDSGADAGWSAFDEPDPSEGGEQESWAVFNEEQSAAAPLENKEEWQQSVTATPAFNKQTSRRESHSALLSDRLERLFHSSFPETPVLHVGEDVTPLKALLEPSEESSHPGQQEEERCSPSSGTLQGDVWRQLLDIHGAFGLRHQWAGSHSNKTLLCSLGIDIRNILFTGQKKQAMIVPMYAASLGMLEPTKEPVKPISAAEMITSIAQTPPVVPAKSSCPPDTAQETLPPVQFDWSSSGLTNPLDASGGSSLLNLDFFGPVEDSGSTSTPSIPGVDPELYELTTAKLDPSGSSSRVADAFARLMSTMDKTSTSTRKPRKEENLSEEASKVIAGLPDLSFMQAKVLMFPTTLTPLGCTAEPTPD